MRVTRKIAIDLGTTSTLMYIPKSGIVLNEPSVVAVSLDENAVLAIGNEAKEMIGRTPENIVAKNRGLDSLSPSGGISVGPGRYYQYRASGRS